MLQGLNTDIYLLNVCCCSKVSFTHYCTMDNLGNLLLYISAHLRQPCSSVLTCRYHDGLIKPQET